MYRQRIRAHGLTLAFWKGVAASLVTVALLASCAPRSGISTTLALAPALHGRAASHIKMGGTVIIDNVSGSLWTCSFNPYGASTADLAAGIIYEPLLYINPLNNAQHPWLATGYAWSNGNKTLTFTIRSGVKWSDGRPLTAADVAFTFNLMKKFSGLDLQAVWTVLSGVRQQGNRVVFTFKQPAVPFLYYIADQNFILPQHIWSKIKNPVTYTDTHPVGSGPFTLQSCSPQDITYVRNAHYWQKGKPYISEVRYPSFLDNQPGNLFLAQGKANWGGQFIPNVKAYYLSRDTTNRHIWYPPGPADVLLYLNQTVYPLNIRAVRQAISYGIDRSKVSRLGVYGYLPPANQLGIIQPTWQSWYDKSVGAAYGASYNPTKARALLKSAGFKLGSNGIFSKNGKPLSLTIINNSGYTDWVAETALIRDSLRAIGIDVTVQNISGDDVTARSGAGHFQMLYFSPTGGPTPYYQFRQLLYGANSAPIGQTAASNYERYHSSYVDSLLNQYSRTANTAQQHAIIDKIEAVMVRDVPVIPVLQSVNWFQYDTSQIVGWPTPQNPYASPAPYNYPDWEVILLNVHQK
jgi:peptide/nickel transport system substrate-binding protein